MTPISWLMSILDKLKTAYRHTRTIEPSVETVLVRDWCQENWWRFEPAEGWRPGYNCPVRVPSAMKVHMAINGGKIIRPTTAELSEELSIPIDKVEELVYYHPGFERK